MKFVKLTGRHGCPFYVNVASIGTVVEDVMHHAGQNKTVGLGKASVLVQGEWLAVAEHPIEVLRLVMEAAR